ncbi:hypothetical protein QMZ92_12500 [Streptomyces sp. HNM0645]|uniref:hypothetical protein n=1 Tax=Streptomyces sp. HNM0645 TaxID=2782343 RepID=UPI0024B861E9|nr:hypothetical protein [Streptomyces sp. HNM0645]MDI9885195.1 hypothetical protein [Streptomyces sp. HNM0645]
MFEYQLHTIRQAELLRRAEGERLARDVRAARRAAPRRVAEGRVKGSVERRAGGGPGSTRTA